MAKRDFVIRQIDESENLTVICAQMQPDLWGKDNDMSAYRPDSLKKFLRSEGILLVANDNNKIAGAALCYRLQHPGNNHSIYVHELDTHPHYRRQGVATLLMNKVLDLAKERGLAEVWLATESDNTAANALYKKLGPTEVEPSIIYTYKVK